jgi:hypothetical protein
MRAFNFGIYGHARPAETAVCTAVPCILLIRMRSQVQVLAGPPTIVAGHSAAGSEPGRLAAGSGRAGAAPPSPPAPPLAPRGPPARASGSATTTHRGRPPARGRQPRGRWSHLARPPAPAPTAPPPGRALGTPAWPAWSLSGQGRPPRPTIQPGGPGPPPTSPRPTRVRQRRPRPGPSLTVARAVDGPAATGSSTGSGGHGRPATSTWSPPPEVGGDGRVRTDGADTRRLDTRRVDSRQLDAGRVDSRQPSAGPLDDHRR